MSYKIEITAATTVELAGKLLALAATMHPASSDPVMPEVREAAAPKPAKARKAKAEEAAVETATGTGSTTETEAAAPVSDETQTEPTPVSVEEPAAEAPAEVTPLDFDKDVAPVVLAAVEKLGKPWVQGVLGQFGAERASQIEDSLMAEFVAALKDGMA